jgi:hypothetical protein
MLRPLGSFVLQLCGCFTTQTNGYNISGKLHKLTVSSLFVYHPIGHFLQPKDPMDIDPDLRRVAKRFFEAVSTGKCTTHIFFDQCLFISTLNLFYPDAVALVQTHLNFCSFKQGLAIKAFDPDTSDFKSSAKSFLASIVAHSSPTVRQVQTVSVAAWSLFWRLSLLYTQRNVVLRYIYNKIPTRLLLSRALPDKFSSGNCLLCSAPESKARFFFDCSIKATFWDLLIREFLWPGINTELITSCVQNLNFTLLVLSSSTSYKAPILIITALSELWKAHWRLMFDNQPFVPAAVFSNTITSLERRKAEDAVLPA